MSIPASSWLDPRAIVAPSEIHGLGLFAAEPISEGEIVEVLGGTTITDAEVREVIDKGDRYDGITIDRDVNLRIDPPDWPGIHGNHSCDPNLWMADAVSIVARAHIDTGAELTIDYALFTASTDWSLLCACGSEQCRRVIRGDDWRLPALQARYRDHFVPFIQRMITALKV